MSHLPSSPGVGGGQDSQVPRTYTGRRGDVRLGTGHLTGNDLSSNRVRPAEFPPMASPLPSASVFFRPILLCPKAWHPSSQEAEENSVGGWFTFKRNVVYPHACREVLWCQQKILGPFSHHAISSQLCHLQSCVTSSRLLGLSDLICHETQKHVRALCKLSKPIRL